MNHVEKSLDLLSKYEPSEGYYVCFGGGKDSVVMYDTVKKSGVKYDAHYFVTTVEPDDFLEFIKTNYPEVEILYPSKSMKDLIVEKGLPPTRDFRYCCRELKESNAVDRVRITAIRAEESKRRLRRRIYEKLPLTGGAYLHILKEWTLRDVESYISENSLKYFEGCCGCVICPFRNYDNILVDMNSYPDIVERFKNYCRESLKCRVKKGVNPKQWSEEDDMFNWWLDEIKKPYHFENCNFIPLMSRDREFD